MQKIQKDIIDYNYIDKKKINLPDISLLNREQFENYKNLLYKKYNILSKLYKIPKLDVNEPFEKIHISYYAYINLLDDKN